MYPKNDISWDLDKYQGAFNFRISIDRIPDSSMKVVGVSNIISESEIVEYKVGHEAFVRKIPGRSKFSEIEITRIYQGYDDMYAWRTQIEDGLPDLRTVRVELLAPDLTTVVLQMVLLNCWPLRWQLPNLDASSTGPATETITLACEQVTQSLSISPMSNNAAASDEILAGEDPTFAQNGGDGDGPLLPAEEDIGDPGPVIPIIDRTDWLEKYAAALALAPDINESPFDPFAESEDTNVLGDGPVGGRGEQDEADYGEQGSFEITGAPEAESGEGEGEGPIGGRGEQTEAEYGDEGEGAVVPTEDFTGVPEAGADLDPTFAKNGGEGEGPIVPTEDFVGVPEPGEDPTFAKNGGDGSLEITGAPEADYGDQGSLDITGAPEAEYSDGEGPFVPTEDFIGVPEPGEDPTFANNGGDGDGPIVPTEDFVGVPEPGEDPTFAKNGGDGSLEITGAPEADYGDQGSLDITGAPEAEYSDGDGPIVPTEDFDGVPEPGEDPTFAKNGGDGSGPLGGKEATGAVAGGDGDGPIVPTEGFGGVPEPGEDPTAGQNGGDGGGPVGGRGAQAEADYGAPGSGPVGGRGAQAEADYGSPGSGPVGGQGAPKSDDE
jgi:phage tail-like protein